MFKRLPCWAFFKKTLEFLFHFSCGKLQRTWEKKYTRIHIFIFQGFTIDYGAAKAGARWCFTETLISKSTKPPRQTHMMVLFSEAAAFPFTTLPLTDIAPKLWGFSKVFKGNSEEVGITYQSQNLIGKNIPKWLQSIFRTQNQQ